MSEDLKAAGAEFWNANPCGGTWPTYRAFIEWIQQAEPYIYEILDRYEWRGVDVLEVGCGQGATLNYVAQKGARMTGMDMSLISLVEARAGARELGHADRVQLAQVDAERLSFAGASFDRVLSIGVLHHTPDIDACVAEIHRVLRPGGTAIVMLYRSGNPKWWATRTLRGISSLADRMTGERGAIANRLRRRSEVGASAGTALLELFGVPTMHAYSNRRVRRMFRMFDEVRVTNHEPGFRRLPDIVSAMRPLSGAFRFLDRTARNLWGFYQVIELKKS